MNFGGTRFIPLHPPMGIGGSEGAVSWVVGFAVLRPVTSCLSRYSRRNDRPRTAQSAVPLALSGHHPGHHRPCEATLGPGAHAGQTQLPEEGPGAAFPGTLEFLSIDMRELPPSQRNVKSEVACHSGARIPVRASFPSCFYVDSGPKGRRNGLFFYRFVV